MRDLIMVALGSGLITEMMAILAPPNLPAWAPFALGLGLCLGIVLMVFGLYGRPLSERSGNGLR